MTRRRGPRLAVLLVAAAFTALAGLIGQAGLAALDRTEGWRARLGGEMTVAIRATEPAAVADAIIDAIGDAAGELAPVSQDTRDEIRDTITRHVAGLVNLVGRVKGKGVDRG